MAARRVRKWAGLKPGWWVLGGITLLLVAWFVVPGAVRNSRFFRLRRVEFVGLRYLSPATLASRLHLPDSTSLLDAKDSVEARLEAVPGVLRVSVSRRIPGTLRVRVTEEQPVAIAPGAGGMVLVDRRGRALPFDPSQSAPDLPVAQSADSLVATLLARVRETDPALFARVTTARRRGGDVALEVDGKRFLFRPDASAEAILAVTAVAADLARKGHSFEELDGRYDRQVVVRGMGA
ncbi:MAG: cell division protein FtsQ/DivIB [Gemmatimonadales bacterium]